jgi:hypothetical protein
MHYKRFVMHLVLMWVVWSLCLFEGVIDWFLLVSLYDLLSCSMLFQGSVILLNVPLERVILVYSLVLLASHCSSILLFSPPFLRSSPSPPPPLPPFPIHQSPVTSCPSSPPLLSSLYSCHCHGFCCFNHSPECDSDLLQSASV